MMMDSHAKAATLMEALPWIKQTWGRTVVIKYGGAAMTDPALRDQVAADIVLMKLVGVNPVVVHGGGPEITAVMERLGLEVEFRDGLRVTTDAAMDVVKMVLVGKVNKELVRAINAHGRYAVGVSGEDGPMLTATALDERLGRVGTIASVDTTVLDNLIEDGFIPVVASVAAGDDGGSFNVNADLAAGRIAAALGADKCIFLTDVDGLFSDPRDPSSLISAITVAGARELIASGRLEGGMAPKVRACAEAVDAGVRRAHILNGTIPHALLLEVYTDEGIGTMITADGEGRC